MGYLPLLVFIGETNGGEIKCGRAIPNPACTPEEGEERNWVPCSNGI